MELDHKKILEVLEIIPIPISIEAFSEQNNFDKYDLNKVFATLHHEKLIFPINDGSYSMPVNKANLIIPVLYMTMQNLRIVMLDIVKKNVSIGKLALFQKYCEALEELLEKTSYNIPWDNDETSITFDQILFLLVQTLEIKVDLEKMVLSIGKLEEVSLLFKNREEMGSPLVLTKNARLLSDEAIEGYRQKIERNEQEKEISQKKQKDHQILMAQEEEKRLLKLAELAWLEI